MRTLRTLSPGTGVVLATASAVLVLAVVTAFVRRTISDEEQRVVEREAVMVAQIVAAQSLAAREAYGAVRREARDGSGGGASELLPTMEFIGLLADRSQVLGVAEYSYRWLEA